MTDLELSLVVQLAIHVVFFGVGGYFYSRMSNRIRNLENKPPYEWMPSKNGRSPRSPF